MVADHPENSAFAGVVTAALESKPSTGKKWRGKLFGKDKDRVSRDEQVDDFLGTNRSASSLSQTHPPPNQPPPSRPSLSAPRLDVDVPAFSQQQQHQQRWPEPGALLADSLPQPSLPSLDLLEHPTRPVVSPPKQKKKRNVQGLKVTFSHAAPEIIGEGGDESEIPTKEISLSRGRSHSAASNASYPYSDHADSFTSDSTGRANSRLGTFPSVVVQDESPIDPEGPTWKPPLVQNAHDSDFLLSLGSQPAGSRLSLRSDGDPNSFARRVQARMRAEEGLALQQARHDYDTPSPSAPLDTMDTWKSPEPQETYLPPQPSHQSSHVSTSPPPAEPPRQEARSGLSFWGSVLSSLPHEQSSSPQDKALSPPPPNPGAFPPTPPPPYLRTSAMDAPPERPPTNTPPIEENRGSKDSAKKNWRSVTNIVGDSALTDFASCVAQYNNLFSLAAESVKPSRETPLAEWIKATVWWFLKGRSELESSLRSRPTSNGGPTSPTTDHSQQGVINLAKAWWINQHIIPQHAELEKFGKMSTDAMLAVAKTTGDQKMITLLGLHQSMLSHLRALAMSMKRNNILPPAAEQVLYHSFDTSIWVKYPFFTPDITAVLSGSVSRSMVVDVSAMQREIGDMMPIADTRTHFCYGRMFVDAYLSSHDDDSQEYSIPCVLSITRDRTDWHVIASITSQNELVNIMVQSDKKLGPTWSDVDWDVRSRSMRVRLPRAFELDVHFAESDFKTIWKIVEYTRKTEESLQPEPGEKVVFENVLKVFQYMDSGKTKAFPPEPTQRCRIRVFEKSVTITEGTGSRQSHRGFRFTAVTSPKVKTLSGISHSLGHGAPIVFGYLRGEDGAPALLLKLHEDGRERSMLLTFHEIEERAKMHSFLLGVMPDQDELKTKEIPMRAYSIEKLPDPNGMAPANPYLQFSSPSAIVINTHPTIQEHGYGSTVLSEHLRVFVNSNWGSVTDRINIGPGELKISLDTQSVTTISLLRPAQEDLTISIAENLVPKEAPETMTKLLETARTTPIVRRYNFASLPDLHKFQHAVTGYKVLFDGSASLFAISRRRMVVPIYKKWEATIVRLQVIEQEKIVQLVAFFQDFSHGKCMNFVLKGTDAFETVNHRSGKFGVRIVDAKFALPKSLEDEAAEFLCLDMPDYPGEHDDITIAFDSETERRNFQSCLPGAVKEPSRMGSLRK